MGETGFFDMVKILHDSLVSTHAVVLMKCCE